MTIKRNQALVMKYIMQNYRKAAYVLDQPRDQRYLSKCVNYGFQLPLRLVFKQFLRKKSVIKMSIESVYLIHFSGSLF